MDMADLIITFICGIAGGVAAYYLSQLFISHLQRKTQEIKEAGENMEKSYDLIGDIMERTALSENHVFIDNFNKVATPCGLIQIAFLTTRVRKNDICTIDFKLSDYSKEDQIDIIKAMKMVGDFSKARMLIAEPLLGCWALKKWHRVLDLYPSQVFCLLSTRKL